MRFRHLGYSVEPRNYPNLAEMDWSIPAVALIVAAVGVGSLDEGSRLADAGDLGVEGGTWWRRSQDDCSSDDLAGKSRLIGTNRCRMGTRGSGYFDSKMVWACRNLGSGPGPGLAKAVQYSCFC